MIKYATQLKLNKTNTVIAARRSSTVFQHGVEQQQRAHWGIEQFVIDFSALEQVRIWTLNFPYLAN